MASKYTAPNDYRAFCEMLGETENSMSHHGVKGMHWGERKYQNPDGSLTEAGRKHYGYGEARKKKAEKEDASDKVLKEIGEKFNFNTKYTIRDPLVKKAIAESKKWNETRTYGTREGEKEARGNYYGKVATAAIGAGALGGIIGGLPSAMASYTATLAINTPSLVGKEISAHKANNKLKKTIDEISANTNVDKKTGLKKKQKEMTPDEDMEKINPGFKNWSDNTKSNCFLCTTAYDLRRKGYDVTANGASEGYDSTAALAWYPKASMTRLHSPPNFNKETQQAMMKVFNTPEGGYGNLSVSWKKGGGHSMVYGVENGIPVLRDCQTNKVYRGGACNKIFKASDELRYTRLDNVQPNISVMKKWGAINPAGQDFKAEVKTNPNAPVSKKKHGDTGILKDLMSPYTDLYNTIKITHLENKIVREKKKALNAVPIKELDATGMGFENHLKLSNAAYTRDTETSPKYLKAIYSTSTKGKSGKDIMVYVGAKATDKDTNFKDVEKPLKDAAQIVKQETSLYAQAKKGLANAKDDYSKEYFSKADLQNMSKNMKINRVEVNNGTKHPVVIFEATAKNGTTTLVDCEFKTLPNGQVILIDTKTGRDYF